MEEKIRKILIKQLELLAQLSSEVYEPEQIVEMSLAMVEIAMSLNIHAPNNQIIKLDGKRLAELLGFNHEATHDKA